MLVYIRIWFANKQHKFKSQYNLEAITKKQLP